MIRHTEEYKPRSWLLGSIADMFLMAQPHTRHRSSHPKYSCSPLIIPIGTPLLRYEQTRADLSSVNSQSNSKGCRLLYSCAPKYVCCCVSSLVFGFGVWTRVYKAHRCRIVGSMRRPPRAPLNEHEPCGLDPTNMRSETHRCRIVGSMRRPPRAPLEVHGSLR